MKPLHRTLVLFGIAVLLSGLYYLNREPSYGGFEEEEEGEGPETGVQRQMESWWQARAFPDPTYINDKWWAAWQHEQAMRSDDLLTRMNNARDQSSIARVEYGAWTSLGPNNGPGGRIISLAVDPNNPSTVYAGSAGGGIFKSINSAGNWTHVTTNLPIVGVSSIIINPSNSDVIYAGTGEVYRVDTSNMGYNVWKARGTYGIGVIKSADGGSTWTQVLSRSSSALFGIQKLVFDPTNYNTVYACATDGLYRTTDAGANWTNIAVGKVYVTDVVINEDNTNEMMIAVGNLLNADKGIYRTANGSSGSPTWSKLSSGLPTTFKGFIRFAYQGGDNVVAAIADGSGNELRRTTNFGNGWSTLNNTSFTSYQHWCTVALGIFPTRPDSLVIGGVNLYRYRVSSQGRTTITNDGIHADMHAIAFHPTVANTFYVGNDGGVWKTTDGGTNFTECNNGLSATQFYGPFGVSTSSANLFVGGLQDNGVWQYNSGSWNKRLGGDGGPSVWVPGTSTVFASLDAREVYKSTNNGGSFSRVTNSIWRSVADSRTAFMAPVAVAASSTNVVYVGSDNLHKSTSTGSSGSFSNDSYSTATDYIDARHKTAIALAVAPTDANRVYVSTSCFAQYDNDVDNIYVNQPPDVRKSTNGGSSFTSIKTGLPNRFIMDFAVSPTNKDSLFVAVGGFGTSHIYLSGNGGSSWVDRGAGLPDVPFNAVLIDPANPQFIYAGSDMGVYVSNNRGVTWYSYSGGFQDVVPVYDLQITANNKLVAATHGRGAWITDLATNAPLPVNILEFTGVNKNSYNELKWKVAEETTVARYELERKIDNGAFAKVATIAARNSGTISSYVQNDDIRNTGGANYYYRLRIVDQDGSVKFSSVVLLKVNRPADMQILGNPVTSGSSINLTVTNPQRIVFKLFDIRGRLIHVSPVDAVAGTNRYSFSMFGVLPAGHYMLQAVTETERYTRRIIVR